MAGTPHPQSTEPVWEAQRYPIIDEETESVPRWKPKLLTRERMPRGFPGVWFTSVPHSVTNKAEAEGSGEGFEEPGPLDKKLREGQCSLHVYNEAQSLWEGAESLDPIGGGSPDKHPALPHPV